jgi:hypothetical protein
LLWRSSSFLLPLPFGERISLHLPRPSGERIEVRGRFVRFPLPLALSPHGGEVIALEGFFIFTSSPLRGEDLPSSSSPHWGEDLPSSSSPLWGEGIALERSFSFLLPLPFGERISLHLPRPFGERIEVRGMFAGFPSP